MTDAIIKRAWRGDAPPPDCESVPFLCLRAIYREFRLGNLEKDTAKHLKERCMAFGELTHKERRSLMVFALDSEFRHKRQLEDIKTLVWALVKETE